MDEPKVIQLEKSVYELCTRYPELIGLMKEFGFVDIVKPGMLQTAGRFMTLPKGAAMKGIDLNELIEGLNQHGFIVE